jgi:hypothetical protein
VANVTPQTATPPKPVDKDLAAIVEAMRELQTEGQAWVLAEALAKKVPTGEKGFDEIMDAAGAQGITANLSANTLKAYRNAALAWPPEKRVPDVSFSAHREAMNLKDTVAQQEKLLQDLSKSLGGPGKVSVSAVRRAVQVKRGKPVTTRGAGGGRGGSGTTPVKPQFDVLDDIKAGSPQLISRIGGDTKGSDLDKLHVGMTRAIEHVERLRIKLARAKAAAAKKSAPATTPVPTTPPPTKRPAGPGDVRGL